MFVSGVYNVLCTPLAIGLLYCVSVMNVTDWITTSDSWQMLIFANITLFATVLICTRLIVFADMNCLINLGLPVTKKQNFVHCFGYMIFHFIHLASDPLIYIPPEQPRIDVATFQR